MHIFLTKKTGSSVVRDGDVDTIQVLGASVGILLGPSADDNSKCVLKGVIPSGVTVPMHSHDATEVFYILSGKIDVLIETDGKLRWEEAGPGDLVETPGETRHAFRNRSQDAVKTLVVTTSRHGRYFQDIGTDAKARESGAPTQEEIQRFIEIAERYGYWLATPEENASVGISVP